MAKQHKQPEAAEAATTSTDTVATTAAAAPAPTKQPEPKTQAMKLRAQANALEVSLPHLAESAQESLKHRIAHLREEADVLSPKSSGKSSTPRPTCTAIKADGTPCTAKSMQGKEVCTDHRPVRERFTDLEWKELGFVTVDEWVELVGWGRAKKLVARTVVPVVPASA